MKKAFRIFYAISIFTILASLLFISLQFRILARFLLMFGVFMFIAGNILYLFSLRLSTSRLPQYNNEFNKRRASISNGIVIGAVIAMMGLLCKIMHWACLSFLTPFGLFIVIIFFILLFLLLYNSRKYAVVPKPAMKINAADLREYTGEYYSEAVKGHLNVWIENNELTARLANLDSFCLDAIDTGVFNNKPLGIVMKFYPGKGESILIQGAAYIPFMKTGK